MRAPSSRNPSASSSHHLAKHVRTLFRRRKQNCLTNHATCPGLPDADELLDGLRHAYSLLRPSTPAPIPESCSQSFTEGLLWHRIKTLEKKIDTLKNGLNVANSKLRTANHWSREYQAKRDVAITITDGNENDTDEKEWHRRSFSATRDSRSERAHSVILCPHVVCAAGPVVHREGCRS